MTAPTDPVAVGERVPAKATYEVGKYDDGSGPKVTVQYDTTSQYTPECVWVYGGDEGASTWIAFDWQDADDICVAIQQAAAALKARAHQPERDNAE